MPSSPPKRNNNMRVIVVNAHVPFVRGGAELLAESLVEQLKAAGHEAELVRIPFVWYPPEKILDCAIASSLLDVSRFAESIDLCIALKFPAYLVQHPNKAVWLVHQHRQAYELWNTSFSDLTTAAMGPEVREVISTSDTRVLASIPKLYTISETVTQRILSHNNLTAQTLYHPPPIADHLLCSGYEDFVFYPSRFNPMKRQELVLEALTRTRHPVRCIFAGAADSATVASDFMDAIRRFGLQDRVQWLGPISTPVLVEHYARTLAVVFPPLDEDYGYVTLEAMLARKAVVTVADAGGPTEFIRDGQEGWVAQPTADALADALDRVWEDRRETRRRGEAGFERYNDLGISWGSVLEALTS